MRYDKLRCIVGKNRGMPGARPLVQAFFLLLALIVFSPQQQFIHHETAKSPEAKWPQQDQPCPNGVFLQRIFECIFSGEHGESSGLLSFPPFRFALTAEAFIKVELLEVLFDGNHSLASDYGNSLEPYGLYMDSGEPYSEPLVFDVADSGHIHLVYHHCPYTDSVLQGWPFQGNKLVEPEPNEAPLLLQRRQKMCVARRVELRTDGEQEGSELTLTTADRQEPRFFGYRVDDQGYTAYFVAFTRIRSSFCARINCCIPNSNSACDLLLYDIRKPSKRSLFETVVGAESVPLSRDSPLCRHDGGEDGVPFEYFYGVDEKQLSQSCPNLEPHTYADSFVFLGPGIEGGRVHKQFAIGSLSNTLQIRNLNRMTQVSVQHPNNLWLSQAGAYHASFNPTVAQKSYYIVRGAEYTTADSKKQHLQEALFFYDSLANAKSNQGTQFISDYKKLKMADTKVPDAIFAEHPLANDVTYFHSNPMDSDSRFVAGGGFKLLTRKFVSPAAIKGFCVAPVFYDQWAVFLALEEPAPKAATLQLPQRAASTATTMTSEWESTFLPWWGDEPLPGYSSPRRGQILYMQVPISGSRSYNETTLQVFNASAYRSFQCTGAGSASVLMLHHDAVNHVLHIEERLRDGSLREETQVEIRRVLHGSLVPTRPVMSMQKGPGSVLWVNLLTTKRFSVDESFYYVPAELPGRIASVQRATGFYNEGDCLGEWAPPLASATCSEFCVSLHAYRVTVPSRGGSSCAFQAGTELSRYCLQSPCSRAKITNIEINSANGAAAPAAARNFSAFFRNRLLLKIRKISPTSVSDGKEGAAYTALSETAGRSDAAAEVQMWQDDMLDASSEVPLGADEEALARLQLESALDLWHLRIVFSSVAGRAEVDTTPVPSFKFTLSVTDDAGEEIHTWDTSVPPSPTAQSVWEAMDLRLYRAKSLTLRSQQSFNVAEVQVFGMPLDRCPPGGFLGPSDCAVPTVQRMRSHDSLDCKGAWSEWTACQADCRRKRFLHVYQTEKEGGVPCEFFQQEACDDGLCSSVFGISLLKSEDCYPSPSRWSECIGCRQMRVWHILRAASAGGTQCPSSLFETRSCRSGEGCEINPVSFPEPPDQPGSGDDDTFKPAELMRPIGGLFLLAAVGAVLLMLAALELWRRFGTSMAAYREVLNMQRQRDLLAAREQMREYRQMIQDYQEQLEQEEGLNADEEDTEGFIDSLFMHPIDATVTSVDVQQIQTPGSNESSNAPSSSGSGDNASNAETQESQEEQQPEEGNNSEPERT